MAKGVPGLPVAIITAGGILVWSGIYNQSLTNTLGSLLKGQKPGQGPQAVTDTSALQNDTAPPVAPPSITGGPSGGTPKANQVLGKFMAGSPGYGWSTGAEWTALNNLVMSESGWDNKAQNPTSTAYGIFQFLDTTWAGVGYTKTSDPVVQIAAGLKYVKQRYGDPIKAWAFHQANNWY